MTQTSRQSESNRAVAAEDGLSIAWVMAGVVMFATALGAPVAVFHMQASQTQPLTDAIPASSGKAVTTASREVTQPGRAEEPYEALASLLGEGEIVPGVGIGPVVLDTDVEDLLQTVQEPSRLSYAFTDAGLQGQHDVMGPDFRLTVTAEPELGEINSVALSALDCAELRTFQPRQNGLPATEEGLSLGSHVSRVRTTLGAPDTRSPVSGQEPRVELSYPGLRLSFCAQDMLVGGIKIERLPPAPLITAPLIAQPSDAPSFPADDLVASLGQTRPDMPDDTDISAFGPDELPSSPLPPTLDETVMNVQVPGETNPMVAAPTPLLAMNGGAFTVGDAFSLSPDKRESGIMARLSPPAAMLLAAARTNRREEVDIEFEGVPDFLVARAAEAEAVLNLTRDTRGDIQRRLQLIGYDPQGVDGIFGPNTRREISKMQAKHGLPATGFLDTISVEAITRTSEPAYAKWEKDVRIARAKARAAERLAAEQKARTMAIVGRVPAPRNAPGCVRDSRGVIISNQSFSCDLAVLGEGLNQLFSGRRS